MPTSDQPRPASRPFPWKCAACRERSVHPVTLPLYETELAHDGRKYPLSIPDLAVCRCETCGTITLTDIAFDRLSDALRIAAGLLMPNDILVSRIDAGMPVEKLAMVLGVSESVVERWEAGHQIQTKDMDGRLRAIFGAKSTAP